MAGDAIHKVTPNSALGGCTAMEDSVAIANQLHELLNRHPNKKPSTVEISAAMQDYQDSRIERVKAIVKVGGDLTRLQAFDGWYFYIMQRWVTPWIGLDTLAINIARLCSAGTKLDFVEFPEQKGLLGWQDTIAAEAKKQRLAKRKQQVERAQEWWSWNGELQQIWPLLMGLFCVLVQRC
jgi:2-polyprenyl-6-methoxyphenol hydroxylase and related FAD-dependent oxidoreductases